MRFTAWLVHVVAQAEVQQQVVSNLVVILDKTCIVALVKARCPALNTDAAGVHLAQQQAGKAIAGRCGVRRIRSLELRKSECSRVRTAILIAELVLAVIKAEVQGVAAQTQGEGIGNFRCAYRLCGVIVVPQAVVSRHCSACKTDGREVGTAGTTYTKQCVEVRREAYGSRLVELVEPV